MVKELRKEEIKSRLTGLDGRHSDWKVGSGIGVKVLPWFLAWVRLDVSVLSKKGT